MLFSADCKIILASQSPRRQSLLKQIGVGFELLEVEIDESIGAHETPIDYAERMAREKAEMAWQGESIKQLAGARQMALLTADTCIALDGQILGKPRDIEDARRMLAMLSGRQHQVLTSVMLKSEQFDQLQTSITQVEFCPLTKQEIDAYCATEEGLDKAAGYAIQGVAAQFIVSIQGSYSGVVGLPLFETSEMIKHFLRETS